MRKTVILLVIACLGIGSGLYVAHLMQSKNMTPLFADNKKATDNGPWTVNHPSWTGKLAKTGNDRVVLDINGDTATIISNKNGVLTVKWDKWGSETFKCDSKNICTLK